MNFFPQFSSSRLLEQVPNYSGLIQQPQIQNSSWLLYPYLSNLNSSPHPLFSVQNSILNSSNIKENPSKKLCSEMPSRNMLESILLNNLVLSNASNQTLPFHNPDSFSNVQSKLASNNILSNLCSVANNINSLNLTSNLPKLVPQEISQVNMMPSLYNRLNSLPLELKNQLEISQSAENLLTVLKCLKQEKFAANPSSKTADVSQDLHIKKENYCINQEILFGQPQTSFSIKNEDFKKSTHLEEMYELSTNDSEDKSSYELSVPLRRKKTDAKKKVLRKGPLMSEQDIVKVEPYEIKLHLDSNQQDQTKSTPLGQNHQALIPEVTKSTNPKRRTLNEAWDPNLLNNENLEEILLDFSSSLMNEIDNEQKALKLLVKAGMDKKRVSDNLKKNRAVYRQYFGIQVSPPKSKKKGKK
jgi:hypothetical protein